MISLLIEYHCGVLIGNQSSANPTHVFNYFCCCFCLIAIVVAAVVLVFSQTHSLVPSSKSSTTDLYPRSFLIALMVVNFVSFSLFVHLFLFVEERLFQIFFSIICLL